MSTRKLKMEVFKSIKNKLTLASLGSFWQVINLVFPRQSVVLQWETVDERVFPYIADMGLTGFLMNICDAKYDILILT